MRRIAASCILLVLSVAVLYGVQLSNTTAKKKTTHAASGSRFTLECAKVPFDDIATKPDPFRQCGNCGVVSADAKPEEVASKAAQSHAKNNFCADTSQITNVTVANLRDLESQAAQKGLVETDIPDRSQLTGTLNGGAIGEGSVVRLVAWVQDAHLSDCKTGEEVNCETSGSAHNDVHIVLVDATSGGRDQDECTSVTAEMSPHFRPAAWTQLDKKIPTSNVIRVTGPLFFDNAHVPCAGVTRSSQDQAPFRSSLWEVHPVYQFEVCVDSDATKCDIANDSEWKPYDQWVQDPASQTAATTTNEDCVEPGKAASGNVPALCPATRKARQ
jgi:hypothetical protein